ncbi:MAG: [CysO sulfur-carrier protein]-S-L-cysteine hydrolase [Candidatus Binatota bacterium]|nr:[CysO sulfur-carrier protein]-S-L-cysteine hydrolase [Candidatus Binatota bacterium]
MKLGLRRSTIDEIDRHARETYPDECCGAVVTAGDEESVRRITNVQGRLHAEDPQAHPRDARTAYFMEPKELYAVIREGEEPGRALRAFYHSHPEHDAYFSAEDQARAMAWDEPAYPDAAWVVVSVRGGEVRDRRAYAWDANERRFAEIPLAIES